MFSGANWTQNFTGGYRTYCSFCCFQEILTFSCPPHSIAAHVAALSQLSPTEATQKKAGQRLLTACQGVLDSYVKEVSSEPQKVIAALYTISKVSCFLPNPGPSLLGSIPGQSGFSIN